MTELLIEKPDASAGFTETESVTNDQGCATSNIACLPSKSCVKSGDSAAAVATVTLKAGRTLRGRNVIAQNLGAAGSLCFVVRRPG
jgi:hypothetical protein